MTTKVIDIHLAQEQVEPLLELIDAGTEIILTEENTQRARLLPYIPTSAARTAGLHRGSIEMSDDFDAPLSDEFWLTES